MTHGVIILARFDSARLPGKALADVGGRPVLSRLLQRLRVGAESIGRIVLATTARPEDDPLAEWAAGESVPVIRPEGPVDDVAGRFVAAARIAGFRWAARVNGDSPLVDATQLAHALKRARSTDAPPVDLVTNLRPRRHPYGMAVEWIRVDALAELLPTFDASEREHVTAGLYATLPSSRVAGLDGGDPSWADVRTVVDTADDLDRLRRFVADHGVAWPRATTGDIVEWIARAERVEPETPEPSAAAASGDAADERASTTATAGTSTDSSSRSDA